MNVRLDPAAVDLLHLYLVLFTCLFLLSLLYRFRRRRRLNRGSIKEAIDNLPMGVCYFSENETVKLCNREMDRLYRELSGRELQGLSELREALAGTPEKIQAETYCLSRELQLYHFADGSVRRYEEKEIMVGEKKYTESLLTDVTELYEKKSALEEQTKRLQENMQRLSELSENALQLSREREVLAGKTLLHNQLGAATTAIKKAVRDGSGTDEAVRQLRQAMQNLRSGEEESLISNRWEELQHDAELIGVKICFDGTPPKPDRNGQVILLAVQECLTNAVRHADATELTVTLFTEAERQKLCITNNGKAPVGEILPRGGLKNLQDHVTACGGEMEIVSQPQFRLQISLPEKSAATVRT